MEIAISEFNVRQPHCAHGAVVALCLLRGLLNVEWVVQVNAEWRRVQVTKDASDVRRVAFAAVALSFASSGGGAGGIELWFAGAGAGAGANASARGNANGNRTAFTPVHADPAALHLQQR
ncbi:hypothetical protein BDZ97DRAFT_1915747 [Flammula alnicola]|nr:hypothetical protein BDZ97DRAFT_1915747 [Flammula alnicola]